MERTKRSRTVGLVLIAGLLGYLIGPPIVEAASTIVTIKGAGTTHRAKVSRAGRLRVDTEASRVLIGNASVTTVPGGVHLLKEGTATTSGPGPGVVTAVVLDVPPAAPGPVKVSITTSTTFVWEGTAPPGQHLSDTFGGGMFYEGNLNITITGAGGRFAVYGYTF
jgi:hypothetical protein